MLVTEILDDFVDKDMEQVFTREVAPAGKPSWRLLAPVYEREDDVGLVIAHPLDPPAWLRVGTRPTAEDEQKSEIGAASP